MIDEKALLAYIARRKEVWEDVDDDRHSELCKLEKQVRSMITEAEPEAQMNGFHLKCLRLSLIHI